MSKKRIGAQTGKKNTQSDFVSLCGVRGGSHRFAIYRNTIPLCPHSSFTTLAMDFSIFIVPVDIIESEYGKPFVCRGMIGKGPAVLRPLFDIYGRRDLLYFAGVLGALSTNCQANDDACKSLFAFLCADVLKGCKMLQV